MRERRAKVDLVVECEELEEAVFVDKDMWEKIVLNLLSNALKFTMHGQIRVSVKTVTSTLGWLAGCWPSFS
jgi:signal transduction histidine kinase